MSGITVNNKTRVIIFWMIFTVLLFVRIWDIGIVPGDINQDEAMAGYNTYTLLHDGKDSFGYSFPMYLTAWGSGMNALESYLCIPFVLLFGLHTWTIRLVPLIISMLSLVTIYKLIRENMEDDIFALFTMFFTGVMPWHIMLSRWALESNLAPAFLLFGLYFFLKGMKNEKYYIFSAILYGLSLYTYATIWTVLPFILIAQVIYAILKKQLRLSRYTVISGIILVIIALPAMLFLLVNYGVMNEVTTPLFSIPKLVAMRSGEISLSHIPDNLKNLWNIIISGSDGLPWNTADGFGFMYKFSLPFTAVGIIFMLAPHINNLRIRINHRISTGESLKKNAEKNKQSTAVKTHISLSFFLMVYLIASVVLGALISVNINRINIIFLPLILAAAYGWYALFTKIVFLRERLVFLPFAVYMFSFICFELYYFTDYRSTVNPYFYEGISDAMDHIKNDLPEDSPVYVAPSISYSNILFYDKTDLDTYLNTVSYANYPAEFLSLNSFGRYVFGIYPDQAPDEGSIYLLDASYDNSPLVLSMTDAGFTAYKSGNYTVYSMIISRQSETRSPI